MKIEVRTKPYNDRILVIDGKEYLINYRASRVLTGTDIEAGDGIFNRNRAKVQFQKGGITVDVDFGSKWTCYCCHATIGEIIRRVVVVNNAFSAAQVFPEKEIESCIYTAELTYKEN